MGKLHAHAGVGRTGTCCWRSSARRHSCSGTVCRGSGLPLPEDGKSRTAQPTRDPCPGTRRAEKEIVGVDTEARDCYFTDDKKSLLHDLQNQIRSQNALGERHPPHGGVPGATDRRPPGPHRTTRPRRRASAPGRRAAAQKTWNKQAIVDQGKPMLKILVANTGFAFGHGKEVAQLGQEAGGEGQLRCPR
ncbi:hypothetical protein ACRAWF_10415 [Streptomyces sp. L7]